MSYPLFIPMWSRVQNVSAQVSGPAPKPIIAELGAGQSWAGQMNIVGIIAEEDSEIQINGSRLYPMKADEGLVITGITIRSIYCKSGKVKIIGFWLPQTAMPRMVQQRSVTLYGVQSAVYKALSEFMAYGRANTWLPAFKLYDYVIPAGEKWGLAGNMVVLASSLEVDGSLYVLDESEVIAA